MAPSIFCICVCSIPILIKRGKTELLNLKNFAEKKEQRMALLFEVVHV